jgi:hypothetical protein
MDTKGYVELIRKMLGESYYKITRLLGVTDSTMARWRAGKGGASEETALKIAELSKTDPALVLADIDIEHAKSEEVKAVRRRIKEILQRSAVAVIVVSITAGVLKDGLCILCQIIGRWAQKLKNRVFRPLRSLKNSKNKGLNNDKKDRCPGLERLPDRCDLHLPTHRTKNSQESNRTILVHDPATSRRRTRAGKIARAWATAGLGLVAVTGTCSAQGRITVGTVSHHTGSTDYHERNPALCLETEFERFFYACALNDSHNDSAGIVGLGRRIYIKEKFYIGGIAAFKIIGKHPGGLGGGLIGYGNNKINAELLLAPKIGSDPGITYLTFGFGF